MKNKIQYVITVCSKELDKDLTPLEWTRLDQSIELSSDLTLEQAIESAKISVGYVMRNHDLSRDSIGDKNE